VTSFTSSFRDLTKILALIKLLAIDVTITVGVTANILPPDFCAAESTVAFAGSGSF